MPTVEENYAFWNDRFDWSNHRGDVWSREWGGPTNQWYWCVYPRIRRQLPTGTILEIGPGQGRWTHFLLPYCERLVLVDISHRCIEVCRDRFGKAAVECHVGDGRTLSFQEDESVDFVFSFESLVHTEILDLTSYLKEVARVLKPKGRAFLHHSNLGHYPRYYGLVNGIPGSLRTTLQGRGVLDFDGWRALSVSAEKVRRSAEQEQLTVHSQELVPWGGKRLIDCFTSLGKGTAAETKVYENHEFAERAREVKTISYAYEIR
ncbi:MAG TPA: class I SAM-dependent methyltransferase [Phycisphaerales bacterium]|nr:class I SAM-dependent methyltransferase [Phycisphaerales bacterium]